MLRVLPPVDLATQVIDWQDRTQPFEARAAALAAQLNMSQLIGQLGRYTKELKVGNVTIRGTNLGQECLAGYVTHHYSTAFPHIVNLGATFDATLVRSVGSAIGDEARAALNHYGGSPICLTPGLNVARDPRWGRSYESFGEDPRVIAVLGAAMTSGLQFGLDDETSRRHPPAYLKMASIAKHLGAYSVDCYTAPGVAPPKPPLTCALQRQSFDAIIDATDLHESYLPGWRAAAAAGMSGFMCSYNSINGVPACADGALLTRLARDEWRLKAYVISDADALDKIYKMKDGGHGFATNYTQAAALAINAGVDVDFSILSHGLFKEHLPTALSEGMTNMTVLRRAAARALYVRFATGELDPPAASKPWSDIPTSVMNGPANTALAKEAAIGSFVLLKHSGTVLPLGTSRQDIGVFGPAATDVQRLINRYTGHPRHVVSVLEGISARASQSAPPVAVADHTKLSGSTATAAAAASDVAVVVLDAGPEGEMQDRVSIALPAEQQDLLDAVAASGKPIILVLVNGGAVALGEAEADSRVGAIIDIFTGGEQAGTALGALMFGDRDFSGRLPVTVYQSNFTKASRFDEMGMRAYPGRGHRYLLDPSLQLYPFGHGLRLQACTLEPPSFHGPTAIKASALRHGESLPFHVAVRCNERRRDASISVLVLMSRRYVLAEDDEQFPDQSWPKQWLLGFKKELVPAGADVSVHFELGASAVSRWNGTAFDVRPGTYPLWVIDGLGASVTVVVT